jgi:hypothetical protein
MQRRISPGAAGTLAFSVVIALGTALLTGQFFWIYSSEISHKGYGFATIAGLLGTMALSLVPLLIPIAGFAYGVFAGRKYYGAPGKSAGFLRHVAVTFLIVSTISFFYNGFVATEFNMKSLRMLYSLRSSRTEMEYQAAAHDSELNSIFNAPSSRPPSMCSFPQLIEKRAQTRALSPVGMLQQYETETIRKCDNFIAKVVFYPVVIFLLAFAGALLGYCFRRSNVFFVAGLFYFMLCLVPYALDIGVTLLISNELSPYLAEFLRCVLLFVPVIVLLRIDKSA